MLCHRCGSHVPDEAETCQNCGQSLSGNTARPERPNSLVLRRRRRQQTHGHLPFGAGSLIDDRYEVQEVLGSGALGAVFKVYDRDLDMDLALKIIQSEFLQDPETIASLRKATKRVRKLTHSNIVRIYDEGTEGDVFYFTMQYLEGLTLRKIINLRREKQQLFNLQEVEPIFLQIVEALEYAHTTTFHGYLKPQNIIVLPDLLKLTDFGIIQALPFQKLLEAQKQQPESLIYLAPEVLQGQPADSRADIYSLGVILGEMLTCEADPELFGTIHEANPEAHPLLDDVYQKAVAINPAERYQHVSDLIADLTSILEYGELAEDEEVPTVIVDASLDEYTDKGAAFNEDEGEIGLAVHSLRLEEDSQHKTIPADFPPDSSVRVADSVMELSAADAELLELEEDLEQQGPPHSRRGLAPPPLPSINAGPKPPAIRFEQQSSTLSLHEAELSDIDSMTIKGGSPPSYPVKVATGRGVFPPAAATDRPMPPPLPSLSPPPSSIAAGDPRTNHPQPLGSNGGMPPSPFGQPKQTQTPPNPSGHFREDADTVPAEMTPQLPPSQPPPLGLSGSMPFIGSPGQIGPPPLPMAGMQPQRSQSPEDTGFSRAGIFFGVLGIFLIFGTGGIGLYFKFVYLPRYRSQNPPITLPVGQQSGTKANTFDAGAMQLPPKPDAGSTSPLPGAPDGGSAAIPPPPRAPDQAAARPDPPTQRPVRTLPVAPRPRRDRPRPPARRRKIKPRLVAVAPPVRRKAEKCPKGMAFIRKGAFRMGSASSDPMRSFTEKKEAWTRTKAYCIDRFEYPGAGRRPKTSVSFYAAQKLCEAKGKRLCDEKEWERACKGYRNTRFPYGDKFDDKRCNTRTSDDKDRSVTSSGKFRKCRSPYGVYDMSGNVEEWTSSPFRGSSRQYRVTRGGSAKRPDWSVRCASRSSRSSSSSKSTLGFRCCADAKE